MGLLALIRRVVLREHEVEHEQITRHLSEADHELAALEVRLQRLEIERRLRERRGRGRP